MVDVALPEQLPLPQDAVMAVWVIYDHPRDFPKGYVLRPQYVMDGGKTVAATQAWYAADPDDLRAIVPMGLTRLARMADDDRAILETWL